MARSLCGPGSNPGSSDYRWRIQIHVRDTPAGREIVRHDGCLTPTIKTEKRKRVDLDDYSNEDLRDRLHAKICEMHKITSWQDLQVVENYLWFYMKCKEQGE